MSASAGSPRVSIGVPVYNGGALLRAALDGLLSQTFADFEVIISDNASTDDTAAHCRAAAARDPRVRVVRQPDNIGPLPNFLAVLEQARGAYFAWAAHDDLRTPDFLAELVAALDLHPTAGLAACQAVELDLAGRPAHPLVERGPRTTVGMARRERLLQIVAHSPPALMYGLFRTDLLRRFAPILVSRSDAMHTDLLLLHALLGEHDLAFVERPLLRIRMGGDSHRTDRYRSVATLVGSHVDFARRSLRTLRLDGLGFADRVAVRRAQFAHVRSVLRLSNFWGQLGFKLSREHPALSPLLARGQLLRTPSLRRLRARCRALPRGARVALFGGGKHTVWLLPALRAAIEPHARLVGVLDDRPAAREIPGVPPTPVVAGAEWEALAPDVVVVSSETYERLLTERARRATGGRVPLWTLYDAALEAAPDAPAPSEPAMNATNRLQTAS